MSTTAPKQICALVVFLILLPEGVDGHADMRLERQGVDSARVDRFERRQLLAVLVHQVGQPARR